MFCLDYRCANGCIRTVPCGTSPGLQSQPNTGWLCPRCNKAHAPWVPSCDCPPQLAAPWVTTTLPLYETTCGTMMGASSTTDGTCMN